MKFLD
jgi:hypothetical protein